MGLATEQKIATKEHEKSEWSMRRLFPLAAISNALAKTFISVFDVLLGFSVLVIGVGELVRGEVSWPLYVLTVMLLVTAFAERHSDLFKNGK